MYEYKKEFRRDCKLKYAKFIRNSSWVYSDCLLVYDSVWLWCLWVSFSFWLVFMSVSLSDCLSLLNNDESLFIALFKRPSVPVVLRTLLLWREVVFVFLFEWIFWLLFDCLCLYPPTDQQRSIRRKFTNKK